MVCNKVRHGSPTLKSNQRTLRFCEIGLYKAQLICLMCIAQRKKCNLKFSYLKRNAFQKVCKLSASSCALPISGYKDIVKGEIRNDS